MWYTNWVGTSLAKKQHLRPKLEGVWARGTSKKNGTPYLFLQSLKLATSNLVCNLGLGLAYQKTTFRTKIGGGWARGASKNLGPLCISATVEASNFKFGTQIGFGTSLPKKRRLVPKLAGVWARGSSKIMGPPTYFCNR